MPWRVILLSFALLGIFIAGYRRKAFVRTESLRSELLDIHTRTVRHVRPAYENAVRALEAGLSPYNPAVHTTITPVQLLIHERNVNLILQPHRRLGDMYRFGIRAPQWSDEGEAVRAPGTVMPLNRTELQSNCHILGTC